jgi:hypothetical protein
VALLAGLISGQTESSLCVKPLGLMFLKTAALSEHVVEGALKQCGLDIYDGNGLAYPGHSPGPDGEIGRRSGLKIRRPQGRGGSSPPLGTNIINNLQ